MIRMPRAPFYLSYWSEDQLVEITINYRYESRHRSSQFQGRVRMTRRQIEIVGLQRIRMALDDILYDNVIPTEEFDKVVVGMQAVSGQPTRYGTFKIYDMKSRFKVPKSDEWGSLKYAWR